MGGLCAGEKHRTGAPKEMDPLGALTRCHREMGYASPPPGQTAYAKVANTVALLSAGNASPTDPDASLKSKTRCHNHRIRHGLGTDMVINGLQRLHKLLPDFQHWRIDGLFNPFFHRRRHWNQWRQRDIAATEKIARTPTLKRLHCFHTFHWQPFLVIFIALYGANGRNGGTET